MTEEWKGLTDPQKKQYEEMSNREKDRYEREMREYRKKQSGGNPEAAPEKLAGKKRPAASPQKATNAKAKAEPAAKKQKSASEARENKSPSKGAAVKKDRAASGAGAHEEEKGEVVSHDDHGKKSE